MNQKGGMSITTIILLVLGIIAMIVVISFIFTGKSQTSTTFDACNLQRLNPSKINLDPTSNDFGKNNFKDIDNDRLPDFCDWCVCAHPACGNLTHYDKDNDGLVDACDGNIGDTNTKNFKESIKKACKERGGKLTNVRNEYGVQCRYDDLNKQVSRESLKNLFNRLKVDNKK